MRRRRGTLPVVGDPLIDAHGRRISDLRVSVTDRCNFRCSYCMPADGIEWLPREGILSFEEIERVVRLFVGLGIEDVRLTGGEPLVRRDFPRLVGMLAGIDGLRDLSLTTNGFLLDRHADALVAAGQEPLASPKDSPLSPREEAVVEAGEEESVSPEGEPPVAAEAAPEPEWSPASTPDAPSEEGKEK